MRTPGGNSRTGDALRILALSASFALTAYAGARLFSASPAGTAYWFAGSAVLHDLVLVPLYAMTDAALVAVLRRWPALAGARGVPWINHLRIPAVVSGTLLMVWLPLILRLPAGYGGITGYTTDPYLQRWLLVTGALFTLSAVAYALRLWRTR